MEHTALEQLLSHPPYSLNFKDKKKLLLEALNQCYRHHFHSCEAYRNFCQRRGFTEQSIFNNYEEFPFLPVQAFKDNGELLRSSDSSKIKVRLQSSATSGIPSTVLIDQETSKLQIRALSSVLAEVLGPKRRPFLVLDLDPSIHNAQALGARGAAVRGFLNLAREANYFIHQENGELKLLQEKFSEALNQAKGKKEPLVILGFTYVLYLYGILPLLHEKKSYSLPQGSSVIHIGGWKKLEDKKVSKEKFNQDLAKVLGISETDVIDFYGFTEQMGIVYPDNPHGNKQIPLFSEVIVRDPVSFKPVPDGSIGILQFLSPIPRSYPGLSVLTDDLGMIVTRDRASSNWKGTELRILGRAKNAEIRGCGDIMGEKLEYVHQPSKEQKTQRKTDTQVRLLFDSEGSYIPRDIKAPVDLKSLPQVKNIHDLSIKLREGRKLLEAYTVDELISLIGEAAKKWLSPESPLYELRQSGLLFLHHFCKSTTLRKCLDRSLLGKRGVLDGFSPQENASREWILAQARGLVAHWLSGNVPLLAMFALAQSIVTRNANLLKSASSFSSILPLLLDSFRGLEVKTHQGKTLRGDDILQSVAVIYYPKEDLDSGLALSKAADVRLAWGGKEAVESVMQLPRRYGTEDIIFGPKLSFMLIGREYLQEEASIKRLLRQAAVDASVFDQYACASPHTIFVETGGVYSPKKFAELLSLEMAKTLIRIPKQAPDAGTVSNINRLRMKYEFTGELWTSEGTEWTVLYDEDEAQGTAEPCYSRVITVRAIKDVSSVIPFVHSGIQTIGLALEGKRRFDFAKVAAERGAERFPDIGRMTYFDSPWDGLYLAERLIRWVSMGGPYWI